MSDARTDELISLHTFSWYERWYRQISSIYWTNLPEWLSERWELQGRKRQRRLVVQCTHAPYRSWTESEGVQIRNEREMRLRESSVPFWHGHRTFCTASTSFYLLVDCRTSFRTTLPPCNFRSIWMEVMMITCRRARLAREKNPSLHFLASSSHSASRNSTRSTRENRRNEETSSSPWHSSLPMDNGRMR